MKAAAACRATAAAALAAMLLVSVANLHAEWQERIAECDDQTSTLPSQGTSIGLPPRSSLIYGVIAGRRALRTPSADERQRLSKAAQDYVGRAARARPNWGEACVAQVFIGYVRQDSNEDTAAELARSYRCAPFASRGAAWRLHFAASKWPILNEETRAHVIDEAVWLARGSRPDQDKQVRLLLKTSSEAYKWYESAKWIQPAELAS
jgi:hypothetical protein